MTASSFAPHRSVRLAAARSMGLALSFASLSCAALAWAPAAWGQTISEGLSLHIKLDEKPGSASVADTVKPEVKGTLDRVDLVPGTVEGAARFDGKRSGITFPSRDFGDVWTVALHIRPDKADTAGTLLANCSGGAEINGFAIQVRPNGALAMVTGNGLDKVEFTTKPDAVKFGAWSHIALIVDARRRSADVYINGALVLQDGKTLDNYVTHAPWRLGSMADGAQAYAGLIDDVRIYNEKSNGLVIRSLSVSGKKEEAAGPAGAVPEFKPAQVNFTTHIKPVLESRCVSCHGPTQQKGGLRLDTKSAAIKGGENGTSLVPGKPEKSPLFTLSALPPADPDRMPAKGDPLTPVELAALKAWVQGGAMWTGGSLVEPTKGGGKASPIVIKPIPAPGAQAKPDTIAASKKPSDLSGHNVRTEISGNVTWDGPDNKVSKAIDQLVEKGQKIHKAASAPLANDETFLRRAYLVAVGRIPTLAETRDFLDSDELDKRNKLVDQLLDSPGHESLMYNFWANDMLRIHRDTWDPTDRYAEWVKAAIKENRPYDKMVFELITAKGNPGDNGAVGFHFRDRDTPLVVTSMISQVFLGVQIGCAQCHNHKFDKWTQKQFYEQAAFLAPVASARDNGLVEAIVKEMDRRGVVYDMTNNNDPIYGTLFEVTESDARQFRLPFDYAYPENGKPGDVVMPNPIFPTPKVGGKGASGGETRREAFARWVTSKDNPMFAKVMANRLWKQVFGVGIAEPIDDWKDATKPTNEPLLAFLAQNFVTNKFNIKEQVRAMMKTRSFQLTAAGESDLKPEYYAQQALLLRRMSAEQVFDSWQSLIDPKLDRRKAKRSPQQQYLLDYQTGGPRTATRAVDFIVAMKKGDYKSMAMAPMAPMPGQPGKGPATVSGSKTPMSPSPMKPMDGKMMMSMGMSSEDDGDGKHVRASEMLYPTPFGSFMHIFGQSARETLAADSKEPGLQQVLYMLNGDMANSVLARDSAFRKAIDQAASPALKVNILFLSLLNRYPSSMELQLAREEIDKRGFDGVANVTRALMNSREFLFLQ